MVERPSKYLLMAVSIAFILIVGVSSFFHFLQLKRHYRVSPVRVDEARPTLDSAASQYEGSHYIFETRFVSSTTRFSCRYRVEHSDTACVLFGTNPRGETSNLNISVDEPAAALMSSPDGKYLLVVLNHKAILLDAMDFTRKTIIEVADDEALGTYSGVPTFMPAARWIDTKHIEFAIYPEKTLGETVPRYDLETHRVVEPVPSRPNRKVIVSI